MALLKRFKIIRPAPLSKPLSTWVFELRLPEYVRSYEVLVPESLYEELHHDPDAVTDCLWDALKQARVFGIEHLEILDAPAEYAMRYETRHIPTNYHVHESTVPGVRYVIFTLVQHHHGTDKLDEFIKLNAPKLGT